MDGISVNTEGAEDQHFGILKNLNINYVTTNKKNI